MPAAPPSYDASMAASGAGGFAPPPPPGQVGSKYHFKSSPPLTIAAIPPCSLVLCWLWKSQHQMYPGLPGKEGAPPPPASYPPPQVYLFTPWHQLVLLPCINANDLSAMMNLPSSSLRVRSRLWLRCVAPEKEWCKLDSLAILNVC